MSVDPTIIEAVQEVLQAQARRAQLYAAFQTAFREMCDSGQEAMYLRLLPQLTEEFQTTSGKVIACGERLTSQGQTGLATTVRKIQENERTKLQATISLQALRKAQAFKTLPWQNGGEAAWSVGNPILAGETEHAAHSCCHHADSKTSPLSNPAQVTEQEWHDACAQSTAALEDAVRSINDAMEEMRYELIEEGQL